MTRPWDADGKPRKPRVVCIGAQKAGTSWLHQQLNEHPKIWTTPFKEVHYFNARHRPEDRQWLPWHFREAVRATERRFRTRGEDMPDDLVRYLVEMTGESMFTPRWYRQAFAPAPRGMLPLDTTPEYSTMPDAGVAEAAEFLPRAKFIYLIRDPVERAISQLRMNLARRKLLPKTPDGYLRHLDDPDLDDRGDYATYLPRWQAHIPPDRLLVLPYGRIARDPAALMTEVEAFLGLDPGAYPKLTAVVHKGADAVDFPDEGRAILRDRFARQYDFLAQNFDSDFNAALDGVPTLKALPTKPAPRMAHWADDPRPRKPSVVGIGAQKAGTSWLFAALRQHPGLWTPPVKETHYFDHLFCPDHRKWTGRNIRNAADGVRAHYVRVGKPMPGALAAYLHRIETGPQFTEEWYRAIFSPAPAGCRPVEITPAYCGLPPNGLDHLTQYLPKAQFIYLIRDPVDRFVSQLRMNLQRAGRKPATLDDWRREAADPVLEARGDYATYLPRWQARVPSDRLLVLPFGRIASDPEGLLAEVERFLGLTAHNFIGLEKRVFAARGPDEIPDQLRAELADRLAPQYAFLRRNFDEAFNAALR